MDAKFVYCEKFTLLPGHSNALVKFEVNAPDADYLFQPDKQVFSKKMVMLPHFVLSVHN